MCDITPKPNVLPPQKQENKKLLKKVKYAVLYTVWYLLEEGLCMCISDCTCGGHRLPLKIQPIGLDTWEKKIWIYAMCCLTQRMP